jgi:hypothetical protein
VDRDKLIGKWKPAAAKDPVIQLFSIAGREHATQRRTTSAGLSLPSEPNIIWKCRESEVRRMIEHLDAIRAIGNGRWGKARGIGPTSWFWRNGGKTIEPLYIWSAAAGFFIALVLIAVAILIQTRNLP